MFRSILLFILLWLLTMNALATNQELTANDFAYGIEIKTGATNQFYQINLPAEVYQHLTRADLGDIRIYNGAGEVVPFTIEAPRTTHTQQTTELAFFPIYGAANQTPQQLHMQLSRNGKGTIITVADPKQSGKVLRAYVLDTTPLKNITSFKLLFDWKNSDANWINTFTISGSNDLHNWIPLLYNATLAQLYHQKNKIEQREIVLNSNQAYRYLLLSWPTSNIDFNLTEIAAEYSNSQPLSLNSIILDPIKKKEAEKGNYEFHTKGFIPATQLEILQPQTNNVIQVELLTRPTGENPWQKIFSGIIYRLVIDGKILQNSPIMIARTSNAYWLLRIVPQNSFNNFLPRLKLSWPPARVIFLARGTPPFLLAYGNYQATPATTDLDLLIGKDNESKNNLVTILPATWGEHHVFAGNYALTPPTSINYLKFILWGLLIIAVLFLAWMVRNLYRQFNAQDASSQMK